MRKVFLILILIFLNVSFLFAETINIQSGYLERRFIEGKERIMIKGTSARQAVLKLGTQTITGDMIEIWGENNRYIQSDGSIEIIDTEEEILIRGASFFFDRTKDILQVRGNVYMEDKKNAVTIRSNFIESLNKEKIINMQMNVRLFQEDMTARAEFAIYDREKEELELLGFPIVHKKSDIFQSSKIIVNLNTEEITLQGRVNGTMQTEEDDTQTEEEGVDQEQ